MECRALNAIVSPPACWPRVSTGHLLASSTAPVGFVGTYMWMRATRWVIAALIGSAMTTIGCAKPLDADEPAPARRPSVADDSLVHAFDTQLEMRLIDRIELDAFLRDRDIYVEVSDGIVNITGEVWTPLEKQRVGDLIRNVAGVVDVANDLVVRPPE